MCLILADPAREHRCGQSRPCNLTSYGYPWPYMPGELIRLPSDCLIHPVPVLSAQSLGEINPQGVRFIPVGIEGIAGHECNVVLKTLFKQRNRINGII